LAKNSLITTAPPERVPIKTHIMEYDEQSVKDAINFELARNGQIYYVVPRAQGILQKLFWILRSKLCSLITFLVLSIGHIM
jgi:transcription-repair coupling factor (superfamily II helicase)